MAESGRVLVERFGDAMKVGDLDALADMYTSTARIASYAKVSQGRAQIRDLYQATLATHGHDEVMSVDRV